jgi:hypothetical protein
MILKKLPPGGAFGIDHRESVLRARRSQLRQGRCTKKDRKD